MKTAPRPPLDTRAPRRLRGAALSAHGEPAIWMTGGALALALLMIVGLLGLVAARGLVTFWPAPIVRLQLADGAIVQGEVTREEPLPTGDAPGRRRLLRTENFELTGEHFRWVDDAAVLAESRPEWALLVERRSQGRAYGELAALVVDGQPVATGGEPAFEAWRARRGAVAGRLEARADLEEELGEINDELEALRLAARAAVLAQGEDSGPARDAQAHLERRGAELGAAYEAVAARLLEHGRAGADDGLQLQIADGRTLFVPLDEVVRAVPANRLGPLDRLGVYASRAWEFVSGDPREANTEGGVFPAIYGTVVMTLIMSLLVVPFGVLAALYLKEYARQGLVISIVRVAVNNLAGVPSIVYGVFGLGFFCYGLGGWIDATLPLAQARLPSPTFGTSGILWASLTLALLTLPVVIVATEEALAAVPGSLREGSYACGASKWQTIQRIVLPRALPGIMTGMILAVARGAGEVAPLMLVGAVKLAAELPLAIDSVFPFVHAERTFMHLGFHIYDTGFQSQNSEAAKPMVFTTTLLLIGIVVILNVIAVRVRTRLRSRYVMGRF